jgi:hypothetical protein
MLKLWTAKLQPSGILTADGIEHKVDVIACATGFDTTFRPGFPIIGLNNRILREEWGEGVSPGRAVANCRSTILPRNDGVWISELSDLLRTI